MSDEGRPLPKFGEWDVNDPSSAESYTVIFNKARDDKKTGGKPDSPSKRNHRTRHQLDPARTQQQKKWFCCMHSPQAES
ncbi:hypothetical protein PHAVU_008G279500 [Phaseolus vulgaris]